MFRKMPREIDKGPESLSNILWAMYGTNNPCRRPAGIVQLPRFGSFFRNFGVHLLTPLPVYELTVCSYLYQWISQLNSSLLYFRIASGLIQLLLACLRGAGTLRCGHTNSMAYYSLRTCPTPTLNDIIFSRDKADGADGRKSKKCCYGEY
jgi:hypothetical protein